MIAVSKTITTLLFTLCWLPGVYAQSTTVEKGVLENLGPQVMEVAIQGSVFAKDASGRELIYTVVRGEPAHLVGFDVATNKLIVDLPIEKTDGVWDLAVSGDVLYIAGGHGGFFYKHLPGSKTIQNLGKIFNTENYLWDLVAGKNGEVFGATYPGCRVFRYHPEEGFSDVGAGPLVAGENYVRSLVYHAATEKIYAGIGAHAHLIELDLKTGSKKNILPEKYKNQQFVYNMRLIEGLADGDRLFLSIQNLGKTLIYNLASGRFEHEIDDIYVKTVIKSPFGNTISYTAGKNLFSSKLSSSKWEPVELTRSGSNALASKWSEKGELLLLNVDGELIRYDPKTGSKSITKLKVPAQPTKIINIVEGPDGSIWTGGYLSGHNARYDLSSRKGEVLKGLAQTESFVTLDSQIYFGIYPKGRIYMYNTRQPWDLKKNNPKLLGRIPGQDRPFGGLSVPALKKVFFGTVPNYGTNGGALVEYDLKSAKLSHYDQPVEKQSVVNLVYSNGVLIGGTSIWGGLGIAPEATEAKLFGWDPGSGKKLWELVPVPGAKVITSLINGSDGKIWGIASGGSLFVFDPIDKRIVNKWNLFEDPRTTALWRADALFKHRSGDYFAGVNGELYRISPQKMTAEKLNIFGSNFIMTKSGTIFFSRSKDLWMYHPATKP